MTDHEHIESKLHDAAAEIRVGTELPVDVRRRIRRMRLATVTASLVVVAALVLGGGFAASALLSESDKLGPAESTDASFARFFPTFEGDQRAVLEMDSAEGTICYSVDSLANPSGIEKIVISQEGLWRIRKGVPSTIELKPNDGYFSPSSGDNCVGDIDHDAIARVMDDPSSFFLVVFYGKQDFLMAPLAADENEVARPSPHFEGLEGWHTADTGLITGGDLAPQAWASTVAFDRSQFPDMPRDELSTMGPDDVFVIVILWNSENYPAAPSENFPRGDGTFDMSDAERSDSWEGQPDPDVPLYQIRQTEEGRQVGVWVFFGTRLPGPETLGRAQEALDALVIPEGVTPAPDESDDRDPDGADQFGALWPEDTAQEAQEGCGDPASPTRTFRYDAMSTALEFGNAVLGWKNATGIVEELGHGGQSIELRRSQDDDGPKGPAVLVTLTEVANDCWSVFSVARSSDEQSTGLSISVRGQDVEIGFDALGADSIYFEIGHGNYTNTSNPEPPDGRITALLRYPRGDTGHYLLVFKDAKGNVFSAAGGPLPAGDFSAG